MLSKLKSLKAIESTAADVANFTGTFTVSPILASTLPTVTFAELTGASRTIEPAVQEPTSAPS